MRRSLLVIAALLGGVFLRLGTRPSVEEIEFEATQAWNVGDVPRAESLARQALGRSRTSERARLVLSQVAAHDARPLLNVSLLLDIPAELPQAAESRFRAGDIAFQNDYASLAERAWKDVIELDPHHPQTFDRLTALAGIRMDREYLIDLLFLRAEHLPQTRESIRLLMVAESLDAEALSVLETIQRYLKNDKNDIASRIAIARCLNTLGRSEEAFAYLEPSYLTPAAKLVLAHNQFSLGKIDESLRTLPKSPPDHAKGEYWLLTGLIAVEEQRTGDAVAALKQAVTLRPLNREIRSRYCEALKLHGDLDNNRHHVKALRTLQEIEMIAKNPKTRWNRKLIEDLIEQSESVQATDYIPLLKQYQQTF